MSDTYDIETGDYYNRDGILMEPSFKSNEVSDNIVVSKKVKPMKSTGKFGSVCLGFFAGAAFTLVGVLSLSVVSLHYCPYIKQLGTTKTIEKHTVNQPIIIQQGNMPQRKQLPKIEAIPDRPAPKF